MTTIELKLSEDFFKEIRALMTKRGIENEHKFLNKCVNLFKVCDKQEDLGKIIAAIDLAENKFTRIDL